MFELTFDRSGSRFWPMGYGISNGCYPFLANSLFTQFATTPVLPFHYPRPLSPRFSWAAAASIASATLHPMKQGQGKYHPPPSHISALGLVCSSKTMAGRESRKYSLTYESALYVDSVLKKCSLITP